MSRRPGPRARRRGWGRLAAGARAVPAGGVPGPTFASHPFRAPKIAVVAPAITTAVPAASRALGHAPSTTAPMTIEPIVSPGDVSATIAGAIRRATRCTSV